MTHLLGRQSLGGKWKVPRCAHALPGINIKAQKWRYTVPRSTPVSEFLRRFLLQFYAYFVKVWRTCVAHKSCFGTFSQLSKYDWKTHNKQWVVILTDFTPFSVRVAAAAASSLQYCSVGSLMADVRQCCFPPGGGGEGGCTFYRVVQIWRLCLALGSRYPPRDSRERDAGIHLSCVVYHLMTQM